VLGLLILLGLLALRGGPDKVTRRTSGGLLATSRCCSCRPAPAWQSRCRKRRPGRLWVAASLRPSQ